METWKIMLSLQGFTTFISLAAIVIYVLKPEKGEE